MTSRQILRGWVVGCLVLVVAAGCGRKSVSPEDAKPRKDLRALVVLYQRYLSRHQGKPPKDMDEFRKFVVEALPHEQAFLGDFNPETGFTSSRDNQPWVWVFPKSTDKPAAAGPPSAGGSNLLVYEKTGVDGKHLAALTNLNVVELDDAEIQKYLAASGGSS